MKRILCTVILIATLLSVFSIQTFADDNAQSGSGDTHGAVSGYAWYNTYQYLWKVTLFVGKTDQASKQSSLTNDFHRIGTIVMKKTGWTVSSSVKFGSATKVDYYSGTSLVMDVSPKIISDVNCPAVPIACDGDIETVKAYFGSTGTMTTLLNAIADDKGTTKENLLSSLSFTIGGQTKTGWSYEYIAPNGISNRVPWVIVYEPIVILNLKDKVTKLAFTATEFALAEMHGWYDWNYSDGNGQNCGLLPQIHLPTSVQLEESWFGYPVYAVTDNNYRWNNEDIVKGGGWGMRWLSAAIVEPENLETDYGCYFSNSTTPAVGGYGDLSVTWINYKANTDSVFCELYRDSSLIWSGYKTLAAGESQVSSFSLYYGNANTSTFTCRINYNNRFSETDPNDNIATKSITPSVSTTQSGQDFGVFFTNIEQPVSDGFANVEVMYKNWTDRTDGALCELYVDGGLVWSGTRYFGAYGEQTMTFTLRYQGTAIRMLEARINYENRSYETDPNDNIAVSYVSPISSANTTYDFSVSNLVIAPSSIYQGEACNISFVSDNWNPDMSYSNILVELLVDGVVARSEYVSFSPYGRNYHTYTLAFGDYGDKVITARINWPSVNYETNRYNNSVSVITTIKKYYDFSVSNLQVSPNTCYEYDSVVVSFRTDSWDRYNSYKNVPVQLLYNGSVIYTEYVDYEAYGGKNHYVVVNVGESAGVNEITVRVNWPDHYNEVDPNNNEATYYSLIVKPKIDLTIEPIVPNSDYRAGMTVVTSFHIYNRNRHNIIPSHNNTVSFEAYYYNGSSKVVISSQKWNKAVVPAYNNNLVYFKWTVPDSIVGKTVYCKAIVNSENGFDEYDITNNTALLVRTIAEAPVSQTPDTQYESTKPNDFKLQTNVPGSSQTATWSMWNYSSGSYTLNNYGLTIIDEVATITPDKESPSAEFKSGMWHMRSGYGFSIKYNPIVCNISGLTTAPDDSYTSVQRAYVTFPEFNYSQIPNKYRTLEKYDGFWQFEKNSYADQFERFHFTPLWYPDDYYVVSVTATDIWTPAGMIQNVNGSNIIKIVDSAYDDWYVGEE